MGIKGLAKLLSDEAPDSLREVDLSSLHGRKIAIDASMAIYQFLIAVRSGGEHSHQQQLVNAAGETTSHIQGLFNRTIRFLSHGIQPVFVFDGKPPEHKSGELLKRRERREAAQAALQEAVKEDNAAEQTRQEKRLVRAGQKENNDCQKLLQLMGVPIVLAPCEAEAQCAALARAGTVYAAGTEDMDALTFKTPVLIRKMTFASATKSTVQSINYAKAVKGLELTDAQFVDLCILLGCDYCDSIRGVGPKTALKLIREFGTIEKILEKGLANKKYVVPPVWLPPQKEEKSAKIDDQDDGAPSSQDEENSVNATKPEEEFIPAYVHARRLFNEHEVLSDVKLSWKLPKEEELKTYLVDEMGFNADRVTSAIEKLKKAHKANKAPQLRMDHFFKVKGTIGNAPKRKPAPAGGKKKKKR